MIETLQSCDWTIRCPYA